MVPHYGKELARHSIGWKRLNPCQSYMKQTGFRYMLKLYYYKIPTNQTVVISKILTQALVLQHFLSCYKMDNGIGTMFWSTVHLSILPAIIQQESKCLTPFSVPRTNVSLFGKRCSRRTMIGFGYHKH